MKFKITVGTLALGVILASGLAMFLKSARSTQAKDVQVREDGVVVAASAQADDAVAEVSRRVGFQVKVPTSIPDGLKMEFVDSALGPAGAPNALKLAFVSYGPKDASRVGSVSVRIEQAGVRFATPDDRAQKIDLGMAGVDAYFQSTGRALGYWIFTSDRGFLVTVTGSDVPPESDIRKMIASLVEE